MDSITQAVLGASLAAVSVAPEHRRKAIIAGAILGTMPDLDLLIDYGDAVKNFTYHRGFSHSLVVLLPFSFSLWLILRRIWSPVRTAPRQWLLAISLALLTHPLLDAHTVYGTQLFWPLDFAPTSWSTIFIIDPLYTLPLIVGVLAIVIFPKRISASIALGLAIVLSTSYLSWSWLAKNLAEEHARNSLISLKLDDAVLIATPTPFNTLFWRFIVLSDDFYLEGYYSLFSGEKKVRFERYPLRRKLTEDAAEIWSVSRLMWFSRGFVKASVDGDKLIITDLRMGAEPEYVFNHVVAKRNEEKWQEIQTELISPKMGFAEVPAIWSTVWDGILDR
jgi:inner membrane protein